MCKPYVQKDIGGGICISTDPAGFSHDLYAIGLGLIGGLAILFLIYGGYVILTSQGNPSQLSKGKSYIFYSIAGLLLAIFGYVFMETLLVNILHIPGISH